MNIKLTSKNGATLKTANKYVKEDIAITIDESLFESSGSSGGTAVPSSGYVEKVYLNYDISAEEIYQTILNANLSYINMGGAYSGYIVYLDENYNGLYIIYAQQDDSIPLIMMAYGSVADINNLPAMFMYMQIGDWTEHAPINGVINVGSTLLPEFNIPAGELDNPEDVIIPVGAENEKLKSIISSTPFSSGSCEPTGLPIEVNKLPVGGTIVPTSGMIERVYVNTSLSTSEVVSILDTLTFVPFNDSTYIWACLADSTMETGLAITRWQQDGGYAYMIVCNINGNETIIFERNFVDTSLNGWNPNFNGIVEFNIENQLELIAPMLNFTPENDKAKDLFSITPFNFTDEPEGTIYKLNKIDLWCNDDSGLNNISEMFKDVLGIKMEVYIVNSRPTLTEMKLSKTNGDTYIYWVESENEGYINAEGTLKKFTETYQGTLPVNGIVSNVGEMTNRGWYIRVGKIYYMVVNKELKEIATKDKNIDTNIRPENIVNGVEILGVTGTAYNLEQMNYGSSVKGEINVDFRKIRFGLFAETYVEKITGNDVTEIGDYAFYETRKLVEANFPKASIIGKSAFSYCGIKQISLSPSIISIGENAFFLSGIESINLGNKISSISARTFDSCDDLKNISQVPETCKYIDEKAFLDCRALEKIDLAGVTSIEYQAFKGCTSLKTVIIRTNKVPYLYTEVFNGATSLQSIYVLDELVDSYKTATNWSAFADKIKPLSTYIEE